MRSRARPFPSRKAQEPRPMPSRNDIDTLFLSRWPSLGVMHGGGGSVLGMDGWHMPAVDEMVERRKDWQVKHISYTKTSSWKSHSHPLPS